MLTWDNFRSACKEIYSWQIANIVNSKFGLDVKEEGESMDIESNLSLEAIRKSLLEKLIQITLLVYILAEIKYLDGR